ncbi:MAG: ATP-dependent helicase HrpB [Cyclobacteriaceae bacterium]
MEVIPDIKRQLQTNNTLILHAPPGAGKSTLLPLALLQESWLGGKKILMLEPRRLAASSIAHRMAAILGEKAGDQVGYRIRFDQKISSKTKIEVITEGILARMIHGDNALEDVGLVIFDEFHERSIHADLGLALCREIQNILRQDLRILVMSATLDSEQLTELLQAPQIESKGKEFPVAIRYAGATLLPSLPEMMVQVIRKALAEENGDILAFLPGQGEIKKTAEILEKNFPELAIYGLFGQIPYSKQQAALLPHPKGKRKIVLATSIAETSLTIEGVKIVVDSGFTRTAQFDPKTGLNRLKTLPITQDAANQRTGRAGRLGPGICYRLWTQATQEKLMPFRIPEILEADLTFLALELAKWGIQNYQDLFWLTPPPEGAWAQAWQTLEHLGTIKDGKITPHGEKIHSFPCHPRIAHMLLISKEMGEDALATDLAALLEEKDPLPSPTGTDINLRIEALRRFRRYPYKNKGFDIIEKIARQYRKILGIEAEDTSVDPFVSGLLLANAFPERIASSRPGNRAQFQMANGKIAGMDPKDDLAHEAWIAIAHLDAREKMGRIFMASPLDPKDLKSLVNVHQKIFWSDEENKLVAETQWKIGQITLQVKPLPHPDSSQVMDVLMSAVQKYGDRLLDFNEQVEQWQNRVLSLKKWNNGEIWPDVSTRILLQNPETWLSFYLNKVKTADDFRKIDLLEILQNSLPFDLQQQLPLLAPQYLELPSGSKIKLKYFSDGAPPVLAARLQELFGWDSTPAVNKGKNPILIHLLSPGFKPVQVTQDLKNFWNQTYHEVKKELKRRYPKHSWPENPWAAQAVKGVRK